MKCEHLADLILQKYHIPLKGFKQAILDSRMTKDQILAWHIPSLPSGGGSLQPGKSFQYRDEFETLSDTLKSGDNFMIKQALGYIPLKIPDEIIVYRASLYPIIPGSYVSESRHYVLEHREYVSAPEYHIYSLKVPITDLGWYGDTHEFIYLPTLEEWMYLAKKRVSGIPVEQQNEILQC